MSVPAKKMAGHVLKLVVTMAKANGTPLSSKRVEVAKLKYNYDGYHFTWPSPDIYNPIQFVKRL